MKNRITALLIGLVAAALTFLYFKKVKAGLIQPLYEGRFTVQTDKEATEQDVLKTAKILEQRLKKSKYSARVTEQPGNILEIVVKEIRDSQSIKKLLVVPGTIQFRELYDAEVMHPSFNKAYELELDHELNRENTATDQAPKPSSATDSILLELEKDKLKNTAEAKKKSPSLIDFFNSPAYTQYGSLGTVSAKDTARLRSLLLRPEVISLAPADFDYIFGPENNQRAGGSGDNTPSLYSLYAVKWQRQLSEFSLGNEEIINAEPDFDQLNRVFVTITFTRSGTARWERFTEKNTGKQIAVVYDNEVLTAPVVQSAIPGGAAQLSGTFTVEEAGILANSISSEPLPAAVTLLSSDVKQMGTPLSKKRILITGLVFVCFSVLGYFLLRILRRAD